MKTTAPASRRRTPQTQTLALALDLPTPPPAPVDLQTQPSASVTARPRRMPKMAGVSNTPVKKVEPAILPQSKTTAGKSAPTKTAAKSAVKSAAPRATNAHVRAVTEPVLEGGRLWKMSGRHGVALVQNAALASELLAIEPKGLPQRAMAVYYDKKGKAFAWQVRFDTERWEELMRRLA